MLVQLDDSIKDEIIANQRMVPPGKSLMALNGALINIEDLDLCLYVLPYFLDSVVSYFYSLFYLSLAKSTLAICFLPWADQNRLKSVYPWFLEHPASDSTLLSVRGYAATNELSQFWRFQSYNVRRILDNNIILSLLKGNATYPNLHPQVHSQTKWK